MNDLLTTILTVTGSVIVAVLATLGVVYAARASSRAQRKTAEAANRQVDVTEWQALLNQFKEQVERLTSRVEKLEAAVAAKDARHWSLIGYTRNLLSFISQNLPGRQPPTPPVEFVDELSYITER